MPPCKSRHLSDMQKKSLVHLLEEEPNLLNATFTGDFTYRVAKQKWVKIANHLNCLPGAHKNWNQWRKTWHDLKQHVKKRRRLCPKGTLAEDDEKLLGLLDEHRYSKSHDDPQMTSDATVVAPELIKEETIFVEFIKSQPDDEELEKTENFQRVMNTELKLGTSDEEERNESREQYINKTVLRKQSTTAEKMFRLKKSYYIKKLSIMQTYYQERIKIDTKNAESRQRIACAMDKLAIKNNKNFS